MEETEEVVQPIGEEGLGDIVQEPISKSATGTTTMRPKKPRRSHHKSRNGCAQCKQRKVKVRRYIFWSSPLPYVLGYLVAEITPESMMGLSRPDGIGFSCFCLSCFDTESRVACFH